MEPNIIVMIITLALPNGNNSVSIKPMENADTCKVEAQIEANDPFVAGVECSELSNGVLELKFNRPDEKRKIPEAAMDGWTG